MLILLLPEEVVKKDGPFLRLSSPLGLSGSPLNAVTAPERSSMPASKAIKPLPAQRNTLDIVIVGRFTPSYEMGTR